MSQHHNDNFLRPSLRGAGIVILFLFFSGSLSAHAVLNELQQMSRTDAALLYLGLGYKHILPIGFDHILFVLSLYLLSPNIKSIALQSAAFTVAHSITLALAMYGVISPAPEIVEPLIALSIMYVAFENIFSPRLKPTRIGVVFLFGLVHGMGFAGTLSQLGLPQNAYLLSLVMFNIGVELGQLSVILLAFILFGKWFGGKKIYRPVVVIPLSAIIFAVAGYWTFERLF